MKKTKRILGILLTTAMIVSSAAPVFADTVVMEKLEPKKVIAYLRSDIEVKLFDEVLVFKDAGGQIVYPIVYKGSIYLPLRSISAIMQQNIEWEGKSKAVYIGKSLSDPEKAESNAPVMEWGYIDTHKPPTGLVTVYSKPDVTVLYDFKVQNFTDEQGQAVYPLNYMGSTYLPLRGVAELMGESIAYDSATQTVSIGNVVKVKEEALEKDSEAALSLKQAFQDQVDLYDQATAKISELQKTKTDEGLKLLAVAISEDYQRAQRNLIDIKAMDISEFTEEEAAAHAELVSFMEACEYYILVMENISYMAVEKTDYSILAETFLNFAVDSSTKLDRAKKATYSLKQVTGEEDEEVQQ